MSLDAVLPDNLTLDPDTANRFWRLDSERQTLLLASSGGVPECCYWGARLPDDENLQSFYLNQQRPIPGASLDTPVPLSLCPEESRGFVGYPGLVLSTLDGKRVLSLFQLLECRHEKNRLTFLLSDRKIGLQLTQTLLLDRASETVQAQSVIEFVDRQKPALRIDWLSAPVLPAPDSVTEIYDYAGRWCGEFQPQATPWRLGIHSRESREGRTSHSHVPLMFTGNTRSNTQGDVYGWHLGWAGGHRLIAEEIVDGRRQIQFGAMHDSRLLDSHNPRLQTPTLYMSYSGRGLNDLMHSFHAVARQSIVRFPDPARSRPLHYNCWEAIYFDHNLEVLKAIANGAADLGVERFVLDDGWFTGRNHDRAALGDWTVDSSKFPDGLKPLIDHVQELGMTFGLWVEPEMINPDSDLYRQRPEWVLGPTESPEGRQQLVLDLSQEGVCDYLFEALDKLLTDYDIEYLKWDHNRVCLGASSDQTLSLYRLMSRLRVAHPTVEIESCASGGGRIDFGILRYTHRVWLSDSNDALERWRMQHEAALLLPGEVTGSHAGPRLCHTSGRILPMAFRAWVAASRHMGLEMDVRELSDEEVDTLRTVVQWWKSNRDWLFAGRLYRLDADDDAITAELNLSHDADRLVVFAAQMKTSARPRQSLVTPDRPGSGPQL